MKSHATIGCASLLLLYVGATAFGQGSAPLLGSWKLIQVERNGAVDTEMADEWKFTKDAVQSLFIGGELWQGSYKVNLGPHPAEIDMDISDANPIFAGVKGKGLGVFRIQGDKLRICLQFATGPSDRRSTALSTARGDKRQCLDFTKATTQSIPKR